MEHMNRSQENMMEQIQTANQQKLGRHTGKLEADLKDVQAFSDSKREKGRSRRRLWGQ